MTITWQTKAETAPTDAEVSLVVYTDTDDVTFTWTSVPAASTNGIVLPRTTNRIPGTLASTNTIKVPASLANSEVKITVTGNVSSASPALPIEFIEYNVGSPALIEMYSDATVAVPGDTYDAVHSPLYTFTLKAGGATAVPNAEVRWSFDPPIAGFVYDKTTGQKITAVVAESTWYPSKTNDQGEADVRVTSQQIVDLTVQATTLGVEGFKGQDVYYVTVDSTNTAYSSLQQLGTGPYTDNQVNLDGTTQFNVRVPANLARPPGGNLADYTGYLYLDGNGIHVTNVWDVMSDGVGRVSQIGNGFANQNAQNNIALFIQDSGGNNFTYYPWQFVTIGHYANMPDPKITDRPYVAPTVVDLQPGSTINKAYITKNFGIPLTVTADFGAPYNDGSWYVVFEWFLNNSDLTRTPYYPSALGAIPVVSGSKEYKDKLGYANCSGFTGPGSFYCDYFLTKNPDVESERVYSDWSRTGYILST